MQKTGGEGGEEEEGRDGTRPCARVAAMTRYIGV